MSTAPDELLKAAHAAAAQAKAHGADEAKVVVSRSRGVDLEWRDGRLERVQERTRRSLSVEIFVDGRYSASSTNDLRPEALEAFFADAVAMTRLLEPDPHRCLPDPAAYAGRADVDLDLVDAGYGDVTSAERRQVVEALEALVREADAALPIVSVSTEVSDTWSQSARVHTNGFEGAREGTSFVLGAMVTVKDADGRRPMGWDYTVRRHRGDLDTPARVAKTAAERARAQLGAGKLPTGRYPIVLVNRAVPRLLGAFLGPLNGPALQQKQSLWDGRLGEAIASPLMTIYDEPHRVRGLGSALWDGDGFATHRRPLHRGRSAQDVLHRPLLRPEDGRRAHRRRHPQPRVDARESGSGRARRRRRRGHADRSLPGREQQRHERRVLVRLRRARHPRWPARRARGRGEPGRQPRRHLEAARGRRQRPRSQQRRGLPQRRAGGRPAQRAVVPPRPRCLGTPDPAGRAPPRSAARRRWHGA
ncbi:MAG: metallopeptidase TldD-related protein [bacterium]